MSSIEERITKHKKALDTARRLGDKYNALRNKWDKKYHFHQEAILNLEKKKAKADHSTHKDGV